MPVKRKQDDKGLYYQWGSGKKYYYPAGDSIKRERARKRAEAQGRAAYASGYAGK